METTVPVHFIDENDECIDGVLPNGSNAPEQAVKLRIVGHDLNSGWDSDALSNLINCHPRKFQGVEIVATLHFLPNYLALFTTILNKTHCLELEDCLSDNVQVCQCFQFHHVRDFRLYQYDAISTNQARHIFDAIASASSLENLYLDIEFLDPEEGKMLLFKALRKNQSLKNLCLYLPTTQGDMFFADAIRAVVSGETVEHLSLGDPLRNAEVPIDAVVENMRLADCTIQSLSLNNSSTVDEEYLLRIISVLQQVPCLRQLELHFNPLDKSNMWLDPLVKALWRNQTLERLNLGPYTGLNDEVLDKLYSPLHLNRAGRRAAVQPGNQLPPSLFPLVLQRAIRIRYYKEDDEYDKPSLESPRADVVFWLLKEVIVPEL